MPSTDVLKQFGLSRNPFTDRTAEKTFLDGSSLYVHSDLQGFRPSGTCYIPRHDGAIYTIVTRVSCRDNIHILWQTGFWQDDHQDAGAPEAVAASHIEILLVAYMQTDAITACQQGCNQCTD